MFGTRPQSPCCPSRRATTCFSGRITDFSEIPLVAHAPAPVTLPPSPYFLSIEYPNGLFLSFIGSFESPGEADAANAHVVLDAP